MKKIGWADALIAMAAIIYYRLYGLGRELSPCLPLSALSGSLRGSMSQPCRDENAIRGCARDVSGDA
jgi:hypothetical protein